MLHRKLRMFPMLLWMFRVRLSKLHLSWLLDPARHRWKHTFCLGKGNKGCPILIQKISSDCCKTTCEGCGKRWMHTLGRLGCTEQMQNWEQRHMEERQCLLRIHFPMHERRCLLSLMVSPPDQTIPPIPPCPRIRLMADSENGE